MGATYKDFENLTSVTRDLERARQSLIEELEAIDWYEQRIQSTKNAKLTKMLEEVKLLTDELEALKLVEVEGLEQIEAAKKMKVSQSTLQRILTSARRKVAKALIVGEAIRVEGG